MRRIWPRLALAAGLALVPSAALANVVWPELLIAQRLVDYWVVLAGLTVEFVFLWWMYRLTIWKTILADVSANGASVLVGTLLLPWFGIVREVILLPLQLVTFRWPNLATAFALVLVLNVTIEGVIYRYGYGLALGRRNIVWLTVANAVSVGIMVLSYWIDPKAPYG